MEASDYPIDIHSGKLLEWLISRKHCSDISKISNIREMIGHAILDMPEDEGIREIIMGNYINYFHCQQIVEVLKQTEANSKNMFGQYSSQRMKDWRDIIKSYQRNGLYLADAAQLVIRMVYYEIPAVKKQIEKSRKSIQDYQRKKRDFSTRESEARERFSESCKQFGIPGIKLKSELLSLAKDLPAYLNGMCDDIVNLAAILEFYQIFTNFMLHKPLDENSVCKMVRLLVEKGNVTMYEFQYGEPPQSIILDDVAEDELLPKDEQQEADVEIDWGFTTDEPTAADTTNIEMDGFEIELEPGQDSTEVHKETGIMLPVDTGSCSTISVAGGKVAKGELALSILENSTTYELILDDLCELKTFLEGFMEEKSAGAKGINTLSHIIFQSSPVKIQKIDDSMAADMLTEVTTLVNKLMNKSTRHLIRIRSSARYVDSIVELLNKQQTEISRSNHQSKLIEQKEQETVDELHHVLLPQLTQLRDNCAKLKCQIEEDISQRYNGRKVHLMGEINSI